MIFEWDDHKNRINLAKHGVSFEEAAEIFALRKPSLSMMVKW